MQRETLNTLAVSKTLALSGQLEAEEEVGCPPQMLSLSKEGKRGKSGQCRVPRKGQRG